MAHLPGRRERGTAAGADRDYAAGVGDQRVVSFSTTVALASSAAQPVHGEALGARSPSSRAEQAAQLAGVGRQQSVGAQPVARGPPQPPRARSGRRRRAPRDPRPAASARANATAPLAASQPRPSASAPPRPVASSAPAQPPRRPTLAVVGKPARHHLAGPALASTSCSDAGHASRRTPRRCASPRARPCAVRQSARASRPRRARGRW